jgi:prepilin-type processing-associated H-X9-DG protein
MGASSVLKLLWTLLIAIPFLVPPASTPEGTITEFIQAINAREYSKAAVMVKGGKPSADFTFVNALMSQGMRFTLGVMKIAANGDNANVTVTVKAEMANQKPHNETETVKLVRVNNDWLIVPSEESKGTVSSLASMTVNPSGIFARAKLAAKKTACLSNIKQLGVAVMIYLADHDDKYTMSASKLRSALDPYTKNEHLWFCPSGSKTVPAYSINTRLIGKSAEQIKDPANTVMLYEGSKGKLDFRHDGTAAVTFADSHAKMIKAADAKYLNWKP